MSNKYTSVYDWLKYIKANVVGINLRELRLNLYSDPPTQNTLIHTKQGGRSHAIYRNLYLSGQTPKD